MRQVIHSLKDIERIEETPIEDRIQGKSAYEALQIVCAKQPDNIALTALQTDAPLEEGSDISYRSLLSKINQTANLFRSHGLKEDESVSHFLPVCPEGFYAVFAAEAVGIVNPINPMLETEHISSIMTAANTRIIVAPGKSFNEEVYTKVIEIAADNAQIHTVFLLGGKDECDGKKFLPLDASIDAQADDEITGGTTASLGDVVAYFHTGGTTGAPKLAIHTQRMRLAQTVSAAFALGFSEQDTVMQGLPMFHVAGSIILGIHPLLAGARVLLVSPEGYRSKQVIVNFWKIIERHKVTITIPVPTVMAAIANVPVGDANLTSLRGFWTGGSPIPIETLRSVSEMVGVNIGEAFGMTELGGVTTVLPMSDIPKPGTMGLRIPYVKAKIGRQMDDGSIEGNAETDEIGILCFRGPCVTPGYKQREANKDLFTADGWFITGDLARVDSEGHFWITGRAKDLIIRSGHNIDPMVIEETLCQHEAVELAAAIGKPDAYAGELPTAYVQLKQGYEVADGELAKFARENISERAAAPTEVIVLDSLPLTGFGKVYKPDLRHDAIRRALEQALKANDDIGVTAEIVVETDPSVGVLAKIFLPKETAAGQISLVETTLNEFTIPHRIDSC